MTISLSFQRSSTIKRRILQEVLRFFRYSVITLKLKKSPLIAEKIDYLRYAIRQRQLELSGGTTVTVRKTKGAQNTDGNDILLVPLQCFFRFAKNFLKEAAFLNRRLQNDQPTFLPFFTSRKKGCSREREETTEKTADISTTTYEEPVYCRLQRVQPSSRTHISTITEEQHFLANNIPATLSPARNRGCQLFTRKAWM